jgi:hypothetical protein
VGGNNIAFDVDSLYEFQKTIDALAPGQSSVFVGTDVNGNEIRIGVLRLADGSVIFTKDGTHYFEGAKEAYKPNVWSRIKMFGGDTWTRVKKLFGVGTYTGKNTADAPDVQKEGQQRLDASNLAYANILKSAKNPLDCLEELRETSDNWLDRVKALLGEKYDELVLGELEKQTGIPAKTIKNVLIKNWDGISEDVIDTVSTALTNAPAQAVTIFATEMPRHSFSTGASFYMELRKTKSPEEILAGMLTSEYPELEVVEMKGVGFQYGRAALFSSYEEAYQRYVLHASLGK